MQCLMPYLVNWYYIFYSVFNYLNVSFSGLITLVGEKRVDFSGLHVLVI